MKNLFKTILLPICLFLFSTISIHAEGNFIKSDIFATTEPGDKVAILIVHFGTTHSDTNKRTIEAINKKMAEAFPGTEVREAWTSRIVIYRLKKRGIQKQNPDEALKQLKAEGYTHIIIQSSNIIEGIEMESLRKDIALWEKEFKEIRIGTPLLYSPADYEAVIDAVTKKGAKEGATLLVGHGTYTPATAQYAMTDYMLKAKGFNNFIVGTIEGYPSFDDAAIQLKKSGVKKVMLMPFMFVAGEHAKNDIADNWKSQLEEQGYQVTVLMEGLGENPDIQSIFIEHARFAANHKYLEITAKKKEYAKGKEKYE